MERTTNLKRRNFLVTVGLGGAGATAAYLTGTTSEQPPPTGQGKDGKGSGYRVTAHVQNYYRTTRV